MDWSTFFKNYQILFASAVALIGVIVTLLVNAWLVRHQLQAERKLDRDRRDDQRRHERRTIRAALISELKLNRDALQLCLDGKKEGAPIDGKSRDLIRRVDRLDDAFLAFLPRIGVLSQGEVEIILKTYHTIQQNDEFLTLTAEPDSKTAVSVIITSDKSKTHFETLKSLIALIGSAITYLEMAEKEVD